MDLYTRIFENTPDALIVVNPDGVIRLANARSRIILGYAPEELVGQHVEVLVPDAKAAAHVAYRERFMANPRARRMGATQLRLRAKRKDGTEFPADIMLSPLDEDGVSWVLCAIRDISDRSAMEEQLLARTAELEQLHAQLTELASRDALTSLLNRRSFNEQLEWMLRNANRRRECVSLLMIDLDRFKSVNDSFGHAEGDRVLRAVSAAILSASRRNDVAARYGGEEFAIVLPDTDADGSMVVAEGIRLAIAGVVGLKRSITASVGASTWCPAGEEPLPIAAEQLIGCADGALYQAKAAGRNCVRHREVSKPEGHLSV